MSQWHCIIAGEKHGPVSVEELHSWIADGRWWPTDQVWTEGMQAWAPYNTVDEFAGSHAPNSEATAPSASEQHNSKASTAMFLGIVSLAVTPILAPLMAVGIWFESTPFIYVAISVWVLNAACATAGLILGVGGKSRAIQCGCGRGMAITGIITSTIALAMMAAQTIIALQFCI